MSWSRIERPTAVTGTFQPFAGVPRGVVQHSMNDSPVGLLHNCPKIFDAAKSGPDAGHSLMCSEALCGNGLLCCLADPLLEG